MNFIHVPQRSSKIYTEITISRRIFQKIEKLGNYEGKTLTTKYKKIQMATQNIKKPG